MRKEVYDDSNLELFYSRGVYSFKLKFTDFKAKDRDYMKFFINRLIETANKLPNEWSVKHNKEDKMSKIENNWTEGYQAGKEEGQNIARTEWYHKTIRDALDIVVSNYRALITKLNKENTFIDSNDYTILGKLIEAEKAFWVLRTKEQERAKTKLKEIRSIKS